MKYTQIKDNNLKKEIANDILNDLPQWFGIRESITEYINTLNDKDFFAAMDNSNCIGFIAINYLNNDVANLYVLGIKPKYHHQGIGTKIYAKVEKHLKNHHFKYITVQTLSAKSQDQNYGKTRKFYRKMGFIEAFESDKIWDHKNPFLLMVKFIG